MAGAGSRSKGSARMAGGTVAASRASSLLRSLEEGIRQGKKETAIIVTRDGQVIRVAGRRSAVVLTTAQMESARGGVMTHNHPATVHGRGELGGYARRARAGWLTNPLSDADLNVAQRFGMREMRAVGDTRGYSYRPRPGDGGVQGVQRSLLRQGSSRLKTIYSQQKAKWDARVKAAALGGDKPRIERAIQTRARVLNGLLAGQNYISQYAAFRQLKRRGYDVSAFRSRPLASVQR